MSDNTTAAPTVLTVKWPRVRVPAMDKLTYADIDRIYEQTGVDIHGEDSTMAQKLAACEWAARTAAGQAVTFAEVYEQGSLAGIDLDTAAGTGAGTDPTPTPAAQ